MLDEIKKHTVTLSDIISDSAMNYFVENFKNSNVPYSLILNIIQSAFMSSMANLMLYISRSQPEIYQSVELIIKEISACLKADRIQVERESKH